MEAKKSPEADLEKRKGSFMLIGLLTALAVSLVAFEWTTFDRTVSELGKYQDEQLEEEIIPASATPPPPPPPPPAPAEMIEIVDDEVELPETQAVETDATADATFEAPPQRTEEPEDDTIFTIVEDQPQFPGGEAALYGFLGKNTKFPQMAQDAGIQGTVYVTFVVDKDGSIKDVKVLRGIGGGCDEEAVRVVKAMPKWNPGKQRGKAVRVQYNLPIKFILK